MNIRLNRALAVSSLIILLLSVPAEAELVPSLDLNTLVSESDLIVVGQVTAVSERERTSIDAGGGYIEVTRMAASLSPNRVLKGQTNDATIYFEFVKRDLSPFKLVEARQFGIFFLKNRSGVFTVTNPYYSFLVAGRSQPIDAGNVLENVVSEFANVIRLNMPRRARIEAIEALRHVSSKTATEVLREAAGNPDLSVRMRAHTALLWRNDISAMSEAVDLLLKPPPGAEEFLLTNLATSVEAVSDPDAIVLLKRLRTARQANIRRATAGALRSTRAEAAIQPLILCLSDSDRDVRYHAVIGLAEITGQLNWGPSTDMFQRDEQTYLEHWKLWGQTRY